MAARNSYWAPWTWYLPITMFALFLLSGTRVSRTVFGTLTFFAFAIRFGSGYEFLTSFALFAAALPILAKATSRNWRKDWRTTIGESAEGFGLAVAGFALSLSVHALTRGSGNIFRGLESIYHDDVVRRTAGITVESGGVREAGAMKASLLEVFRMYTSGWGTDFLTVGYQAPFSVVFGSTAPWALLSLSTLIVAVLWLKKDNLWKNFGLLLLSGVAVTFSWYVLGTAHSYAHPHINYVLWYLLLAPVVFYIPIMATIELARKYREHVLKRTSAESKLPVL